MEVLRIQRMDVSGCPWLVAHAAHEPASEARWRSVDAAGCGRAAGLFADNGAGWSCTALADWVVW